MTLEFSRRAVLQGTGAGALALLMSGTAVGASHASPSLRAVYHMTPPSGWLCDPQRPVYTNGAYQLYYLHSDINNGQGGWDHATTTDGVSFTHHGAFLPLQPNFPVWSGSGVVDSNNTAGFGAGAVVVLATKPVKLQAIWQRNRRRIWQISSADQERFSGCFDDFFGDCCDLVDLADAAYLGEQALNQAEVSIGDA